ncbi:ATP-binding protein [Thermodesulfobacteriota bacterium]
MCESSMVDRIIIPPKKAYEIVQQERDIFVRDCICRSRKQLCPKDTWEVCMLFENASKEDLQDAHPITNEEALSILVTAIEGRAVNNMFYTHTDHRITEICSCCTCCCRPLHRMRDEGNYSDQLRSEYVAVTDTALCVGCGLCGESCFFESRWVEDGILYLTEEQCFGCGRCIESCPEGAISLERQIGRGVSLSAIM